MVSPRPVPSRHDETARNFLSAASRLMDAYLANQDGGYRVAKLRSMRFPAALDWLRTDDVIRLAAAESHTGASRKAFFNRWSTRDQFLPDAVVYALVYQETTEDPKQEARQMPAEAAGAASLSGEVLRIAGNVIEQLQRHPRSYLTMHIGPLLPQHPALWAAVLPAMREGITVWADGYTSLLTDLGLLLRPGWTPQRLAMALQATLDGFMLRYRIQPDDYGASQWEGAGIFADTVLAIVIEPFSS